MTDLEVLSNTLLETVDMLEILDLLDITVEDIIERFDDRIDVKTEEIEEYLDER